MAADVVLYDCRYLFSLLPFLLRILFYFPQDASPSFHCLSLLTALTISIRASLFLVASPSFAWYRCRGHAFICTVSELLASVALTAAATRGYIEIHRCRLDSSRWCR